MSDAKIRDLERRVLQGDIEAYYALNDERHRRGLPLVPFSEEGPNYDFYFPNRLLGRVYAFGNLSVIQCWRLDEESEHPARPGYWNYVIGPFTSHAFSAYDIVWKHPKIQEDLVKYKNYGRDLLGRDLGRDLLGRRIKLDGYDLLTEKGTLWRNGRKTGTVVDVFVNKFYQTQVNITWLRVKLDKAHGRYKYAQAYYDEKAGLMHGASWI